MKCFEKEVIFVKTHPTGLKRVGIHASTLLSEQYYRKEGTKAEML